MTRTFIRGADRNRAEPFDVAAAIQAALESDGDVQFLDEPEGAAAVLAFTLRRVGIVVHVVDLDGSHLATYADPVAAMAHGYVFTDRAACVPPPVPPQRHRSPRRSAREPWP